jgi:hypothetical protein
MWVDVCQGEASKGGDEVCLEKAAATTTTAKATARATTARAAARVILIFIGIFCIWPSLLSFEI